MYLIDIPIGLFYDKQHGPEWVPYGSVRADHQPEMKRNASPDMLPPLHVHKTHTLIQSRVDIMVTIHCLVSKWSQQNPLTHMNYYE